MSNQGGNVMAFYGCEFSFDGIPCFEYGLMVYDINGISEDGTFTSPVEIQEDRTARRHSSLYYGATQNKPLTFSFTFGADINSIDKNVPLDRWDMDVIARWLTGHDEYKYLEITQPDMESVRYKCIISELEYISYGNLPWAFTCQVTCDSPFAYMYPEIISQTIYDGEELNIECRAACKYYYPKILLNIFSDSSFIIINHSDNDRVFKLENLPTNLGEISIDNKNEIITTSSGINVYDKFNYNFFRLVRGYNKLEFKGSGRISIECEYPINIGG